VTAFRYQYTPGCLASALQKLHSDELAFHLFAGENESEITEYVSGILDDPAFGKSPMETQIAAANRIAGLYSHRSRQSAAALVSGLENLFARIATGSGTLNDLCALYDILYGLYWYLNTTIDGQRGFEQLGSVFADQLFVGSLPIFESFWNGRARRLGACRKVGYLMQFAGTGQGNGLGPAGLTVMRGLIQAGFEVELFAYWHFQDSYVDTAQRMGVRVQCFPRDGEVQTARAVAHAVVETGCDIAISDINLSVASLIFSARVAPVQIFYQFGMPFWPIQNIDVVFTAWHSQAAHLGFGRHSVHPILLPWHEEILRIPRDPKLVAAERGRFPESSATIGVYGRLVKITLDYLDIVRRILEQEPDIIFIAGGTGDPTLIQTYIRTHGLAKRLFVIAEFVDGHLWAEFLDIFLNTFPLTGGLSSRELTIRGKPVVSMPSADMPNLATEHVPQLVAKSANDYVTLVLRLLRDPKFRADCTDASIRLAAERSSFSNLADQFRAHFDKALKSKSRFGLVPLPKDTADLIDHGNRHPVEKRK
jgi:glycosyltransferase involved in cell wall biosynthesis